MTNKIHFSKMKLVIVDENCDTLMSRTVKLLQFVLDNKKCLGALRVDLVKAERGGPQEHYIIVGTTYIKGEAAILKFLSDFIGDGKPMQNARYDQD